MCYIDPKPSPPAVVYPPDPGLQMPVVVELRWEASDPAGDPLTYDVYLGTTSNPELVASGLVEPRFRTPILEFAEQYFWRVAVSDDHENTVLGGLWRFTTVFTSYGSAIAPRAPQGHCGIEVNDSTWVDVYLTNALLEVDEGGLDVVFPTALLDLLDVRRGPLTEAWQDFAWSVDGDRVSIAGSDPVGFEAGTTGTFARLLFRSRCCELDTTTTSLICPQNPTGDLRAFSPLCVQYGCYQHVPDGDATGDGDITPEDARCALEGYVVPGPRPVECGWGWDLRADVDCNGEVTPGDAYCIFRAWLDGGCTFCSGAAPAPAAAPDVWARTDVDSDGSIRVVVSAAAERMRAVGFDVHYSGGDLVFADAGWLADGFVEARVGRAGDGLLRVGGFAREGAGRAGDLVVLRFSAREGAGGSLRLDHFVDDLSGAEPVELTFSPRGGPAPGLVLHQNRPNPFNPFTEIAYELPGGPPRRVRVAVYTADGRRVTTVVDAVQPPGPHATRWDGRDDAGRGAPSGVYFCVLEVDGETRTRKMVLLR
jgi:hypothetical protein